MKKTSIDLQADSLAILNQREREYTSHQINTIIQRYGVIMCHSTPRLSEHEWAQINQALPNRIDFWAFLALEEIVQQKIGDPKLLKKIMALSVPQRIALVDHIEIIRKGE